MPHHDLRLHVLVELLVSLKQVWSEWRLGADSITQIYGFSLTHFLDDDRRWSKLFLLLRGRRLVTKRALLL